MRDLTKTDKNILRIQDAISGSEIELYYRMPTTSEMVSYQAKLIKRQGRKILLNAFETRLEFGLKIFTGFRDGDFGIDGKPISSDPQNPNYKEDWKGLLKETAADIITTLAFTVFEGARVDTGFEFELAPEVLNQGNQGMEESNRVEEKTDVPFGEK